MVLWLPNATIWHWPDGSPEIDNFIEFFSGSRKCITAVTTSVVIQVIFSAKRKNRCYLSNWLSHFINWIILSNFLHLVLFLCVESLIYGIKETFSKGDNPITVTIGRLIFLGQTNLHLSISKKRRSSDSLTIE
jgi:hypothetical protein